MKNLDILYMAKQNIKKKFVFLGDVNSINIELIIKSFNFLKKKVNYILICNKDDMSNNSFFRATNLKINEILDPINFTNYKEDSLNIFNINDLSKRKYLNLLNQIKISNDLANITNFDLVTMPIDKSVFKKKIKFIGMTEYLGSLNNKDTIMLMHGEKFSVIPFTTHINLKNIHKYIKLKDLDFFLKNIFNNINKSLYRLRFNEIKYLCYNPHCSEDGLLGNEDIIIKNAIYKNLNIKGPFPADSAFNKIKKGTLYISSYHDQVLIPFKILNKKSINLTLGLNYRRLSPSHGTAVDIKNKYLADNTSYLKCLLF